MLDFFRFDFKQTIILCFFKISIETLKSEKPKILIKTNTNYKYIEKHNENKKLALWRVEFRLILSQNAILNVLSL